MGALLGFDRPVSTAYTNISSSPLFLREEGAKPAARPVSVFLGAFLVQLAPLHSSTGPAGDTPGPRRHGGRLGVGAGRRPGGLAARVGLLGGRDGRGRPRPLGRAPQRARRVFRRISWTTFSVDFACVMGISSRNKVSLISTCGWRIANQPRNPLRLSSLVILGVVARMSRCATCGSRIPNSVAKSRPGTPLRGA